MREIPLTQGQVALVDDEDFERLNTYKWHAHKMGNTYYAARTGPRPDRHFIYMHHQIIGRPGTGCEIDHQDGNGINNQRYNLRLVTHEQNTMNRRSTKGVSRFKGVSWHKDRNKWLSQIQTSRKRKYLGYFNSEEDAARAYDAAALEYFGEFAALNFQPEE